MDKHMQKLSSVCRLCKLKITSDKHYKNPKITQDRKAEITSLFNYDIDNDVAEIHPSHICKGCSRQLDKVKKYSDGLFEVMAIAEFQPHNVNGSCTICDLRIIGHNFSVTKKAVFNISSLIEIGQDAGWKLIQENKQFSYFVRFKTDSNIMVDLNLKIENETLKWKLFVFNKEISKETLKEFPAEITFSNAKQFMEKIFKLEICPGNTSFTEIMQAKLCDADNSFLNKNNVIIANIEDPFFQPINGNSAATVRSVECKIFLSSDNTIQRCSSCHGLRNQLHKSHSRLHKQFLSPKKKRPHSTMSRFQLNKTLRKTVAEKNQLKRKQNILLNKVNQTVDKKGVELDGESATLINTIIGENGSEFKDGSPLKLLWEQQKKASNSKTPSSMRWHPVVVRWCLSIYLRSPGTYEHLRRTGFLKLPHRTTLNQYTNFTDIGTGFNPDVIKRLYDETNIKSSPENHRICSLLFDEMKIKSGLVFSKHTGQLIGFTDLGAVNNELILLEKEINGETESTTSDLATYVLSVMARGITTHFNFPVGYFATKTADASQLYHIMWEAVRILEITGIKVLGFVCDGASQNRNFFEMHRMEDSSNVSPENVVYWVRNKFDFSRKIFFFSDVPHLIKTIRNNLEKSTVNGTRNLMVDGKEIKWSHVQNVYETDVNMNTAAPGLRKLHKITFDHIHLTPRLRMRVNLAAQVLSKSMADALKAQGYEHTKATEEFIRLVDQFFDCLNVSQTFTGQKKRKEALHPYKDSKDWRFKWLENDFLGYINNWEQATKKLDIPKDQQARHCLSYQTLQGIRITVRSFLELVPALLALDGIDYILSDKFNQDPLEEHFGKQRMRGGGNDNPSLEQFMYNERKIIVAKSDMLTSLRGNTRGRKRNQPEIDIEDTRSLPKRKKK